MFVDRADICPKDLEQNWPSQSILDWQCLSVRLAESSGTRARARRDFRQEKNTTHRGKSSRTGALRDGRRGDSWDFSRKANFRETTAEQTFLMEDSAYTPKQRNQETTNLCRFVAVLCPNTLESGSCSLLQALHTFLILFSRISPPQKKLSSLPGIAHRPEAAPPSQRNTKLEYSRGPAPSTRTSRLALAGLRYLLECF